MTAGPVPDVDLEQIVGDIDDAKCETARYPVDAARISPRFLEVCTVQAEVLAEAVHCPSTCEGHLMCRPCLDVGVALGIHRAARP